MRASKAMQQRVLNTPNIEVLFDSETKEILGEKAVEAALIYNSKTKGRPSRNHKETIRKP